MRYFERRPSLFIVGYDTSYYDPWAPLFNIADDFESADVVMFTGGADISPEIYHEHNVGSYTNEKRDAYEVGFFHRSVKAKKPMLGICRGAQLMTALSGGRLFQHVDNHAINKGHMITTDKGETYEMSSSHHQMMRPPKDHVLIAWTQPRSKIYVSATKDFTKPDLEVDPEIIYLPKTKCLCIQGHPEYMEVHHRTNEYVRGLVHEYLLNN